MSAVFSENLKRLSENRMISVIIPVYKVEKYLNKCVESVVGQTYTDLEIILVDDGSPDDCPAMCDAWAERDGRIKVIHKPNGGLSSARNAGLAAASGEYVFFLDSDDAISAGCIELLVDAARCDGSDICIANIVRINENGEMLKAPSFDSDMLLSKGGVFENMAKKGSSAYVVSWGKIYRRELFDGIFFPEGRLNEDEFTYYRLFDRCSCISVRKDALYFYLSRQGSIMSEYTPRRLDVLEALAIQAKFFSDRGFDKTVEAVRRYAYDAAVNTLLANRIGVTDERFKTALGFYKSICRLCPGDTGRSAVRLFFAAYPFNLFSKLLLRLKGVKR